MSFYRSWWLGNVSATDPGRPPLPPSTTSTFVHIVEAWRPSPTSPNRTINVYTNAPYVSLSLNGVGIGASPVAIPQFGYARFHNVPYASGTLIATASSDAAGAVPLGSHKRTSWGAPAAIVLTLDAPSIATGTGGALYLDGTDAALVRASIVDSEGVVCEDDSATRVTFAVSSGGGMVWGTGNGDPANHEPNHAPSRVVYHGLVRGTIRVTQASAVVGGGVEGLNLLALVNTDATITPVPQGSPTPAITVTVTSPGLTGATLDIPTSVDDKDSPLAAAAASVNSAYITL